MSALLSIPSCKRSICINNFLTAELESAVPAEVLARETWLNFPTRCSYSVSDSWPPYRGEGE